MKVYIEFLFWLHIALVVLAVLVGFYLPPQYILFLIILHQLHVKIFNGCILTRYQKSLKGLPKDSSFFQYATKRLFGIGIDKQTARGVNITILLLCLALSIYRFGVKFF